MTTPAHRMTEEDRDRLARHTAAVHQIARWIAAREDVPQDIRDRLRGHITALEGVMVASGHDWIRGEMEATEAALQPWAIPPPRGRSGAVGCGDRGGRPARSPGS